MIVEGQIHGGLAEGVGIALMQLIAFDEDGNCLGGSFMDYLMPTRDGGARLGAGGDGHAVAAPPDRRQGRRRVRQRRLAAGDRQRGRRRAHAATASATSTCRCTPARVWQAMQGPRRAGGAVSARRWRARGAPGVARSSTATVVRAQRPTSARPGDRRARARRRDDRRASSAASCAEATVRLQALRALETGEPLLLRSCPVPSDGPGEEPGRRGRGDNPCLSGGALEIFLEPRLPAPRVAVMGESPVARALARAGRPLGFEAADRRARARPATSRRWSPRTAATRRTRVAPRARGRLRVRRPGRRAPRGAAVLDALRRRRRPRSARARAHPGRARHRRAHARGDRAVDPGRDRRRAPRRAVPPPAALAAPRTAVDPVCGMTVVVGPDTPRAGDVAFCGEGCREACSRMPMALRCGLVLAAGGSRRLGQPKQLLPYRGATLLDARARHGARVRLRSAARRARRRRARRSAPRSTSAASRSCVNDALRRGLLVLDRRRDGRARPALRRARAAARRPAGRRARRRSRARWRPRRRAAGGVPLRRRPRAPVRVRRAPCSATSAALHGDKAVWKLLDRARDDVAEVRVPGPVPLDVDTWEDYEAVLAGAGAATRRARAGALRGARLRVSDVARSPRGSTASTTSPTRAWRRRCSSRCALPQPLLLEGEAGVGKTEAAQGAGRRARTRR